MIRQRGVCHTLTLDRYGNGVLEVDEEDGGIIAAQQLDPFVHE